MKLSRAYEASTKRAETIMEIERRRREEAERRKREEEEREEAMRPIRAQIQRGDDLISEVLVQIEAKQFVPAAQLLEQARDAYELGGIAATTRQEGGRWELIDLYKKPYATAKELALSGAADKLHRAMEEAEEQARRWRDSIEAERLRQEEAIREAAAEVERQQLLELEMLRRRQEEQMRELARMAQEEALELIRSKQRMEEEDRVRRSLSAEELRDREARHSFDEGEDREALEARRKYAEFLERKRVRADGLLPPFLDTADATARFPDAADAATAPPSHGGPPSVEAQPAPVAEPALSGYVLSVSPASLAPPHELHPAAAAAGPGAAAAAAVAKHGAVSGGPRRVLTQVADEPAEEEEEELLRALRAAGLREHASVLREVGVESLSDVRFLDEAIIKLLPLAPETKRSLRDFVLAHV